METVRSKIVKGPKDNKGKIRKFIQIPENYYEEFEFGDVVKIEKVNKSAVQKS